MITSLLEIYNKNIMKRLDLEHFKICIINDVNMQDKIDQIFTSAFENYCSRKQINYADPDVKADDFKEAYLISSNYFFKESLNW